MSEHELMSRLEVLKHPLFAENPKACKDLRKLLPSPSFVLALLETDLEFGHDYFGASKRTCQSPEANHIHPKEFERKLARSLLEPLYKNFVNYLVVKTSPGKGQGVWLKEG